ncbi:MAG: aldolase/citrate lyase family protein [Clostridia bacterium]
MSDSFRNIIKSGRRLIGTWIQIPHPDIAGILADKGFDWICADMEHTEFEVRDFSRMAEAVSGRGGSPVARVADNEKMAIRRVLDAGAEGVIVPLVNNKEEAERAVSFAKYPPEGIRGYSFCRANGFGERFDEYAENANASTAVIVMIESAEAVRNIDEILSVEGVDGIFIGPYDMSGSYGITGQTSHPVISEAIDKVARACKRHGKAAGIHIVDVNEGAIKNAIDRGFAFIAIATDTVFLRTGAEKALGEAGHAK